MGCTTAVHLKAKGNPVCFGSGGGKVGRVGRGPGAGRGISGWARRAAWTSVCICCGLRPEAPLYNTSLFSSQFCQASVDYPWCTGNESKVQSSITCPRPHVLDMKFAVAGTASLPACGSSTAICSPVRCRSLLRWRQSDLPHLL